MFTIANKGYTSFAEFYFAYLSEHSNRLCRELHFIGSTLALFCLAALVLTSNVWWLPGALACSYGFSWAGHAFFEKSHSPSLRHPLYTLMARWVMYWQMLTGQTSF